MPNKAPLRGIRDFATLRRVEFCDIFKRLLQLAERFNTRRLVADSEAGNMMIHRAYMIHAAATNQNPHGRMRLFADIRYQRRLDEIDRRRLNHWSFDDMF